MAASGRSVFQGGELSLKLTVYAWVPSQEELHSLWRADEPQTYPAKKNTTCTCDFTCRTYVVEPTRTHF